MNSTTQAQTERAVAALGGFVFCYVAFLIAVVVFMVWVYWRILTKAGYSGWLALLNFVPFGTFIIMMILAFGNWPALKQEPIYVPTIQPGYQPPAAPAYQPTPAPAPQPAVPAPAPEIAPPAAPIAEPPAPQDPASPPQG